MIYYDMIMIIILTSIIAKLLTSQPFGDLSDLT